MSTTIKKVTISEKDILENLLEKYNEFPTAMQGLGYKEVVSYLNNEYSYEEKYEHIRYILKHVCKSGNIDLQVTGRREA